MGMSVTQCQRVVDAAEFARWLAYWTIEPPTANRMEVMVAQLCRIVAKTMGGRETDVADWIPDYARHESDQTPDQVNAAMAAWFR
jgi:hypothetical protein